jgi:acyl-coenzyme A thioesterase PaaI-like protein
VTARLAALPIEKSPTMAQAASTGEHDYFVRNPVAGIYNPVAPPMIVEFVDGADGGPREVRATVRYGRVYQGPPGFVHGGLVAAVLDDSLGLANVAAGTGGMTGTLTIRYSRPTPLETDLRVEARCLGVEGRKIRSWAGLYDGDTLLAEADAVFIIVTADTFRDAQ